MGVLKTSTAAEESERAVITLGPESVEMMQEEEVPEITAKAIGNGDLKLVLDADTGYTVQDLLDSFNKGNHYQISCNVDGKTDGEFPIKIKLSEKIEDSLSKDWLGKVRIDLKDGKVTVKNKYGQWKKVNLRKMTVDMQLMNLFFQKGKLIIWEQTERNRQAGRKRTDKFIILIKAVLCRQVGIKKTV